MEWHYYQKHFVEKSTVHNFIDKMVSIYGVTKTFSVYEKRDGLNLFIYLETDDEEISRIFIDYFIEGIPLYGKPLDFDSLSLIYSGTITI